MVVYRELFSFLNNFNQAPPLGLAQRARFHNLYDVADLRLLLFIVRDEPRRAREILLVYRMGDASFDGDDDALLHLVADDFSLP